MTATVMQYIDIYPICTPIQLIAQTAKNVLCNLSNWTHDASIVIFEFVCRHYRSHV